MVSDVPRLDERVQASLASYGYILGGTVPQRRHEGPEELIIEILSQRDLHAVYRDGIPVVLGHTPIDYGHLVALAEQYNVEQMLGWELDRARRGFERASQQARAEGKDAEAMMYQKVIDKLSPAIAYLSNLPRAAEVSRRIIRSEYYREQLRGLNREEGLDSWLVLANPDIDDATRKIRMYNAHIR